MSNEKIRTLDPDAFLLMRTLTILWIFLAITIPAAFVKSPLGAGIFTTSLTIIFLINLMLSVFYIAYSSASYVYNLRQVKFWSFLHPLLPAIAIRALTQLLSKKFHKNKDMHYANYEMSTVVNEIEQIYISVWRLFPIFSMMIAYLLLNYTFSLVYVFISTLDPANFSNKQTMSIIDGLYFSTITGATVGYGDIAPSSTIAPIIVIVHVYVASFYSILLFGGAATYLFNRKIIQENTYKSENENNG